MTIKNMTYEIGNRCQATSARCLASADERPIDDLHVTNMETVGVASLKQAFFQESGDTV